MRVMPASPARESVVVREQDEVMPLAAKAEPFDERREVADVIRHDRAALGGRPLEDHLGVLADQIWPVLDDRDRVNIPPLQLVERRDLLS